MSAPLSEARPDGDTIVIDKEHQDGKQKKRKNRAYDNVLRELPPNLSEEEKIQLLGQKYQDIVQEKKDISTKLKQYEILVNSVRHERDQLQGERNRSILQKDKLETLCRELQKQNKFVQEDSLVRTRAEEEKRREVADHFQTSITGIQTQLNEYQTRNQDLRRENQDLADKLGEFIKQHERREEHVQKLMQSRDLEVKLAEAKLNKSQCLLEQERLLAQQRFIRLEEEGKLMQQRINMQLELEKKLKEQIESYKTKYENFNKTMQQSNKLFESAKSEMEKLGKRVKQSERDVVEWRGKWELSQRSQFEVVGELKKKSIELESSNKLSERLSGLCRALQTQLRAVPKANTNQISITPEQENSPAPSQEGSRESSVINHDEGGSSTAISPEIPAENEIRCARDSPTPSADVPKPDEPLNLVLGVDNAPTVESDLNPTSTTTTVELED